MHVVESALPVEGSRADCRGGGSLCVALPASLASAGTLPAPADPTVEEVAALVAACL
jgi:hypothetical protein